jgi:hypothetical protein
MRAGIHEMGVDTLFPPGYVHGLFRESISRGYVHQEVDKQRAVSQ